MEKQKDTSLLYPSRGAILGLGILCLLRATFVILVLRWHYSWSGLWTVMSLHHILFSLIFLILGIMVLSMAVQQQSSAVKRIFLATYRVAEAALAAVFVLAALWTFSTFAIPKEMLEEIGFTGMKWIGAGFGISLVNYILLMMCLFFLDSRLIGRRLGLQKGQERLPSEQQPDSDA